MGHDPRRDPLVQLPPQSHDKGASRLRCLAGRRAVPHQLGELIRRDRLARPPQQHRKQRPQPGRWNSTAFTGITRDHQQWT